MLLEVIAPDHVGTQSTLAREHTQDSSAHEHVSAQGTLAREHVSTHSKLASEQVSGTVQQTHRMGIIRARLFGVEN